MRIGGGPHVNTHRSCEIAASDSRSGSLAAPTKDGAPHRLTLGRRCHDIATWIVPGAILALVPKCPACLAGYLAVGTSFGLSTRPQVRRVASDPVHRLAAIPGGETAGPLQAS